MSHTADSIPYDDCLSSPKEERLVPEGVVRALVDQIADSEQEMCHRLDAVELLTMDLLHLLTSPIEKDEASHADDLPSRVAHGFLQTDTQLEGLRSGVRQVEERLVEQLERVGRQIVGQENRRTADRDALRAFYKALETIAGRLDATVTRFADLEPERVQMESALAAIEALPSRIPKPDMEALRLEVDARLDRVSAEIRGLTDRETPALASILSLHRDMEAVVRRLDEAVVALGNGPTEALETTGLARDSSYLCTVMESGLGELREKLDRVADLSLEPIRRELDRGLDRIAAQIGSQDHRFAAERKVLNQSFSVLGTMFKRLEAITDRLEDSSGSAALESRLAGIESQLARIAAPPDETAEVLRNMAVVLAEILARHDRQRIEGKKP